GGVGNLFRAQRPAGLRVAAAGGAGYRADAGLSGARAARGLWLPPVTKAGDRVSFSGGWMRFSVAIPTCKEGLSYPLPFAGPEEIIRVAQSAEQLGYHSVWGNDHITAPRYVRETFDQPPNFYEPLIVLAYIAASTRRIKLAPSVIVLPMREPVYLAKQVATLDVFSGGRFILGVGVGAYREEFEAIHPDLAPTAQRGQMVDESLEALVRLFREPVASFAGD